MVSNPKPTNQKSNYITLVMTRGHLEKPWISWRASTVTTGNNSPAIVGPEFSIYMAKKYEHNVS
jgi:hypothetical protein